MKKELSNLWCSAYDTKDSHFVVYFQVALIFTRKTRAAFFNGFLRSEL